MVTEQKLVNFLRRMICFTGVRKGTKLGKPLAVATVKAYVTAICDLYNVWLLLIIGN
jgi:purine-nucleoside phosphorylase